MFERRRMINRLRTIAIKNFCHQRAIQNIAENGGVRGSAGCCKLHIDFVEILLGMIEENQKLRAAGSKRLRKSGADAASCSCNEDALSSVRYAEQRCVHVRVQFATDSRVRTAENSKKLSAADLQSPGKCGHPRQLSE